MDNKIETSNTDDQQSVQPTNTSNEPTTTTETNITTTTNAKSTNDNEEESESTFSAISEEIPNAEPIEEYYQTPKSIGVGNKSSRSISPKEMPTKTTTEKPTSKHKSPKKPQKYRHPVMQQSRVLSKEEKAQGKYIMTETLVQLGVDTLFGITGGAIIPFYDALFDYLSKNIKI